MLRQIAKNLISGGSTPTESGPTRRSVGHEITISVKTRLYEEAFTLKLADYSHSEIKEVDLLVTKLKGFAAKRLMPTVSPPKVQSPKTILPVKE